LRPLAGWAFEAPILVGSGRRAQGAPGALRVRRPPGVVFALVVVMVCEPPSSIGVVLAAFCDVVLDRG
jgi:hypothetical protein